MLEEPLDDKEVPSVWSALTFPAGSGARNTPCWGVARSENGKWTAAENGKMFCR
jgi:hypothetical protein